LFHAEWNATQRNASYFLVYAGLIAGLFLTHAAPAAGLNDSGQTLCYDGSAALVACDAANTGDAAPYPGQDGRYGRDAAATAGALTKTGGGAAGFDFTKIANDGTELPAYAILGGGATDWACTRDNVTGLTWEVRTDDNSLRDKDWSYTWYSSDASTNGGNAGSVGYDTCGGTLSAYSNQCNTANFIAAVNDAGLCGATDWRLPSIRELMSIVHYGAQSLAIDPSYFPNTVATTIWSNTFWSASSHGPNPADVWCVNFSDSNVGNVVSSGKAIDRFVRLVRGGQF
jgi:hypothetical protein